MTHSGFALRKRVDDFSLQVSSELDDRFWFRLERRDEGDLITDFLLGSFPASQGGPLLVESYRLLALAPRPPLTFGDVLSGAKSDPSAVAAARERFAAAGVTLLSAFGLRPAGSRVRESRGKIEIVLDVERD